MAITTPQIFQIGNLVISAIAGAGATLSAVGATQNTVTAVTAVAAFIGIIWSGTAAILTGQAAQIKAVEAMPGVSRIVTNTQASPVLAEIAQSDAHPKVEPPK